MPILDSVKPVPTDWPVKWKTGADLTVRQRHYRTSYTIIKDVIPVDTGWSLKCH